MSTAAVAALMDALVASLTTAAAQDALCGPPGGAIAVRRGYAEVMPLDQQTAPSIWISPAAWRPLGTAGGLTLEEHLLDVTIVRQTTALTNDVLDPDIAIAERLREQLEGWHHETGRVVDIAGPLVLDRSKLLAPGQLAIGLQLNCDILRGTRAAVETDESRLSRGRTAVWDAIHEWDALDDAFEREYITDADLAELQLRDPAAHELPAIALTWDRISPEWRAQRDLEWPMAIRATIWVPADRFALGELLAQHVSNAINRATRPDASMTVIQEALSYPPRRVSELTVTPVTLGRTELFRAIRVDIAFALRSTCDPFGA